MDKTKYFVVKKKALPEVLIKVVEAKRLLASERGLTIQEATDQIGISRSSFYKYKDDIFPFHENEKGQTITLVVQMDDTPGLLAEILRDVAEYTDYTSEYSTERSGDFDFECRDFIYNRKYIRYGCGDRGKSRCSLFENCRQGVSTI